MQKHCICLHICCFMKFAVVLILASLASSGFGRRVQIGKEQLFAGSFVQHQPKNSQSSSLAQLTQAQSNSPQSGLAVRPSSANAWLTFEDLLMFPLQLARGIFDLASAAFGSGGKVETPTYTVEATAAANGTLLSYEVRRYDKYQGVRATGKGSNDRKDFMALAGYIGAVGPAQNVEAMKMSMTAPVIATGRKGSLTFTLPSSVETPPRPLNKQVKLFQRPETLWAVHRYSGEYDRREAEVFATALRKQLTADGYKVDSKAAWEWWRYNDPRVKPELRRIEVAVKLVG
mmetsp:Transcript_87288/g.167295  ORF Transcript_87288/g.167295 Transcript_87288/m.167295 type:complete len:288 (-) Transcript_87288:75-938(-)